MLVSLKKILDMAEEGGYAIPAFNVYNTETLMGIAKAAEEARSPVIIQLYSRLFQNEEGYYVSPSVLAAAEKLTVPVLVFSPYYITSTICSIVTSFSLKLKVK